MASLLIAVIAAVCTTIVYNEIVVKPIVTETVETAVDQAIVDYDHPIFANQVEALLFYDQMVDRAATDSIFISMPPDVAQQIIHVVNGREHVFDVKDIVTEYLRHYSSVYQYLRPEDVPTAAPTEIQIDDTTRATIRSDNDRDTVINGILYRIVHE